MNEKEKLIPQRRFKEFKNTGTWEQRKLGEFADISTGKLDANAMVEDGEYDFYTSGMKKYRIDTPAFEGPAITIAGNGATVGYMHLADGEFNAYQRTYVLQNFQANRYFLYSEISKKLPRKIAQEARTGNIPYIVMDMLTELTISLPVLEEEQAKIGAFFKQLDNTIALHQRKLELLKEQKTGFLQKMFPKNGSNVPEIRFSGFTEDWEQRKLIDVAEMFDNLRIPVTASDRVEGNTAYYGANGIQDYVDGFTHDGEFVLIAEDGANDLINYPVNYVKGKIWVNNHAHVVSGKKSELDNLFLTARIKSMNISHWLVGGGRAKLNGDVLKKIPLTLPVYEEQKKIGAYFKHLDDSIALHQKQLEVLKETKKSLLQKMFV